jgi:hypothetical protein
MKISAAQLNYTVGRASPTRSDSFGEPECVRSKLTLPYLCSRLHGPTMTIASRNLAYIRFRLVPLPEPRTMRSPLSGVVALLTAILLTACATPVESSQIPSIPSCCTSLVSLPFSPLPSDELTTVSIGPAPWFPFSRGDESPFVAFSLPASTRTQVLRIYTFPQLGGAARVFVPSVLWLDERHAPIGPGMSPALRQASDLLRGSHFRVEMPVPPGARHAVVYSAAALRDRTFLLHIPASVQSVPIGNGGMIYLPVAARVQPVAASPTGTLRVLLEARS